MRRRVGKGSAYQGPFLISGLQVGIIGVVILITLLISAWNAIDLRKVLDHSTEEYLNDVTMHMAGEIGNTMHHKSEDLAMISEFAAGYLPDSFGAGEDTAELQNFLEEKAGVLEFNFLTVIDRQGKMVHTEVPETIGKAELKGMAELDCVRAAFKGLSLIHISEPTRH